MSSSASKQPSLAIRLIIAAAAAGIVMSYGLLLILSLGSGWTFPNLLPDRMNFVPWRAFASDRDVLIKALLTSTGLSLIVGGLGTFMGLVIGRTVRRWNSETVRFLIYLPFVVAPVIAAICLYDLLIRLRVAGTPAGVIFSQCIFATSFAAVYFSELWTRKTDRLEDLVWSLGGSTFAVWRHVVIPEGSGLIVVCFLQACLYSWLDYGLVSVIGGGNVQSLTLRMFGYIREASVNQAAQAALILLLPALAGSIVTAVYYFLRRAEDSQS